MIASSSQFEEDLLVVDLDVEAVFRSRLRDPRPRKEDPESIRRLGRAELVPVSDWDEERSNGASAETTSGTFYDGPAEVYQA